jgi:uncharacterized membrane protein YraQ (UPF0718 family)
MLPLQGSYYLYVNVAIFLWLANSPSKGVPPYLAITFLLAAPVLNPIVFFSTWAAFRDAPEVIIWRMVFAFIVAYAVGLIFSAVRTKGGNSY